MNTKDGLTQRVLDLFYTDETCPSCGWFVRKDDELGPENACVDCRLEWDDEDGETK